MAFPCADVQAQQKAQRDFVPSGDDIVRDARYIIHEKASNGMLNEGLNLIDINPDGLRLYAKVQGGRVAGWAVTSDIGLPLPFQIMQAGEGMEKKCWVCTQVNAGDKYAYDCWRIDCAAEQVAKHR
jgi:hypothetical protein